jgi:hypothetical protein
MRRRMPLVAIPLLAIWTASAADDPITSNPIPEPIVKHGLAVQVKDLVRLPDTRGLRPSDKDVSPAGWARVSYVRDLPDGRRFANDSRGFLYLIDSNNQPHVYADVAATFPLAVYNRLESGFIGFVFHPEFATNGLFCTVHAEIGPGNPKTLDFIPFGYGIKDVTYHNIITEWHATNPEANTFAGTRREILREAHVVANLTHPMGAVEFNPFAKPGDADYGLLYTSGSDHGFSNTAADRTRVIRPRRSASIRSSAPFCGSIREVPPSRTAARVSAITPFPWLTISPRTPARSVKSTLTDSATLTGFRGISTEPCSPPTLGWTTSRKSTLSATAKITAG